MQERTFHLDVDRSRISVVTRHSASRLYKQSCIYTVKSSSVGRISEWDGLRSRRQRRGGGGEVWGGGVPLPTGERSGEGAVPSPQKKNCIFASKLHVCDAL